MSAVAIRNPDATRQRILDVAFEEILVKGYQGLRVDQVLKMTGLTKGAFYHHFSSKQTLGHAVIDEVLKPWIIDRWIKPLHQFKNPVDDLINFLTEARQELSANNLHTGCPLNNLTQEMSPLDESFRLKITEIWQLWHQALSEAFAKGIAQGYIRQDVEPDNVARFLIATMEGIIGQCKCYMNDEVFDQAGECLKDYIKSLSA
ncbi:TetR/AcrR family transcriptional regulator [Kangiella sp. TOML190]|uniref:TetR/AcrR family transcriptional regulator n=1 Tax=Kangiella sp. TOML190 TaxID=2931351 RepID=UPI002040F33C|nr:TetR/AcrR family transcriptional regulator [Kangiella sp. TOML190]